MIRWLTRKEPDFSDPLRVIADFEDGRAFHELPDLARGVPVHVQSCE